MINLHPPKSAIRTTEASERYTFIFWERTSDDSRCSSSYKFPDISPSWQTIWSSFRLLIRLTQVLEGGSNALVLAHLASFVFALTTVSPFISFSPRFFSFPHIYSLSSRALMFTNFSRTLTLFSVCLMSWNYLNLLFLILSEFIPPFQVRML